METGDTSVAMTTEDATRLVQRKLFEFLSGSVQL